MFPLHGDEESQLHHYIGTEIDELPRAMRQSQPFVKSSKRALPGYMIAALPSLGLVPVVARLGFGFRV